MEFYRVNAQINGKNHQFHSIKFLQRIDREKNVHFIYIFIAASETPTISYKTLDPYHTIRKCNCVNECSLFQQFLREGFIRSTIK